MYFNILRCDQIIDEELEGEFKLVINIQKNKIKRKLLNLLESKYCREKEFYGLVIKEYKYNECGRIVGEKES